MTTDSPTRAPTLCVQCGVDSCFWCEDPKVPDKVLEFRKIIDEKKGHQHRCSLCSLKNIQRGLLS